LAQAAQIDFCSLLPSTSASTMFYICRMTDSFQWEGLRSTTDEDYADQLAEFFSNQYPHSYIDVLTYEEFQASRAIN
jgi:hypothetical protein